MGPPYYESAKKKSLLHPFDTMAYIAMPNALVHNSFLDFANGLLLGVWTGSRQNKESALRLVTGVIIEIHEEWMTGKKYLDMSPLLERDSNNE